MTKPTRRPDLLEVLAGELDEDQRARIEDQALSDDRLFEELASQEDELIDAYLRGDLTAEQESMIASLVATSPRLQESAELGAALNARSKLQVNADLAGDAEAAQLAAQHSAGASAQRPAPPTVKRRAAKLLPWIVFVLLALYSLWAALLLRKTQQQRQNLTIELEALRKERDQLEQNRQELELQQAREQARRRLQDADSNP